MQEQDNRARAAEQQRDQAVGNAAAHTHRIDFGHLLIRTPRPGDPEG